MAPDTRTALLDLAEELAQTRGLNAFSFQDLADGIGIRTASVHHHFPSKEDLGRAIMERYRVRFNASVEAISSRTRVPRRRLELFAELFRETLNHGNRLCLCGMLATEYATLPPSVQREVRAFYEETEAWLSQVLSEGRDEGALRFEGSPSSVARTFLATLEGAMIAARTFGDEKRLSRAGKWLIDSIEVKGPRARGA
jgi:TetR/AcrR family transcriptional repressor of nem operon